MNTSTSAGPASTRLLRRHFRSESPNRIRGRNAEGLWRPDALRASRRRLDEKAKELILFSLVLHSRCHPCFDAHYESARELGITQAELDEAAWCAIAMGGAPVRMFYQECLKTIEER